MLQAVAKPAYLSGFLFYALPRVTGCCAPGGVRVVSKPAVLHIFSSTVVATLLTPNQANLLTMCATSRPVAEDRRREPRAHELVHYHHPDGTCAEDHMQFVVVGQLALLL